MTSTNEAANSLGNLFFTAQNPDQVMHISLSSPFAGTPFFPLNLYFDFTSPRFWQESSSSSPSGTDLVPCVIVKTQGHQICPTPSSPSALTFTFHSGLWPPSFIFGTPRVSSKLSCLLSFPSISRCLAVVGFSEYIVCYTSRKRTPPIFFHK